MFGGCLFGKLHRMHASFSTSHLSAAGDIGQRSVIDPAKLPPSSSAESLSTLHLAKGEANNTFDTMPRRCASSPEERLDAAAPPKSQGPSPLLPLRQHACVRMVGYPNQICSG